VAGLDFDLRPSEEEIWASVKGNVRNKIRKSQKLGVTIEEASNLEFADDLYAQVRDVFAKHSLAPPWGVVRIRELIRTVHPCGPLLLLRARRREGDCIATAVFPGMNRTMHYLSSSSGAGTSTSLPTRPWCGTRSAIGKRGGSRCAISADSWTTSKWRGDEVRVPFLRKSRFRAVAMMSDAAKKAHDVRLGLRGTLAWRHLMRAATMTAETEGARRTRPGGRPWSGSAVAGRPQRE
jgi:hypothetical protein